MSKLKEMNGKYYQECEVVMLATDKKGFTLNINSQGVLHIPFDPKTPQDYIRIKNKPQHLYFLSNEEIKEEDWCLVTKSYKDLLKNDIFRYNGEYSINPDCIKKIIATTDLSLTIIDYTDCEYPLPQPSKEFIKAYIKAYNKGKPITKVLIEMHISKINYKGEIKLLHFLNDVRGPIITSLIPKVNSSNEITIKKIKDSYTREELPSILQSYLDYCHFSGYIIPMKFIEENL